MNLAEIALADEFLGRAIVTPATLLGAHLHHAVVLTGHLGHPLALVDKERHRLLDVDVLAGRAGHHRLQGVPMVGRGDHHGLDVLVIEHFAKVAIGLRAAAQLSDAFIHARRIGLGERHHIGVLLVLKVEDMLRADESVTNETDADAVVGPQDTLRGRGGGSRERKGATSERHRLKSYH